MLVSHFTKSGGKSTPVGSNPGCEADLEFLQV
jgi:hypothetical protein